MKIVIDIPEEIYQKIKETNMVISGRRNGKSIDYILFNAVKNGTPLPKGHGDLIDRGKTVERICKVAEFMNEKRENMGSPYIMTALFIQDNKGEFPTIIEAEKGDKE